MENAYTYEQIDNAARYLRETLQSGKNLNPWSEINKASKKKWLLLAAGVLAAAAEPAP